MTVFITGVGSGIGKATCLHFLKNGHSVIGSLRNPSQASELEVAAKYLKGQLQLLVVDLRSENLQQLTHSYLNNIGVSQIDALINIAGVLNTVDFQDETITSINHVMSVNFTAPALLIQTLLPFMQAAKSSNIVNITSMSGYQGSVRFPGMAVYGASKAALSSLSETLSVEFQEFGIHINALAIGSVNTNMLQKAFPDYTAQIQPNQMAEYIYSFAAQGYKFYNGKTLSVAITNP